jgi:hypothetical protein
VEGDCTVVGTTPPGFLGPPFPTGILEIAGQLLLLRVHRNHRLVLGQGRQNRVIDEVKLGVA